MALLLAPEGSARSTSTVPAACAGASAVSCVEEVKVTDVAGVVPKLTVVAAVKLVPVIVTVLPPLVGPAFGATAVIVGTA